MNKIPFSENELKVVDEIPGFLPEMPGTPVYDFPVAPKKAYVAAMERDPIWQVTNVESQMINPRIIPDNVARAMVMDANPLNREEFGGKDMFGIDGCKMPSNPAKICSVRPSLQPMQVSIPKPT